jgi:hypothetical protein
MLGKIAGAMVGRRMAGRYGGLRGAMLGYGAAALARRGLGPLGLALALGWGAKKLAERRRMGRSARYPSEATPASPSF